MRGIRYDYWVAGGHGWISYGFTLRCSSGALWVSPSYASWEQADEALERELGRIGLKMRDDGRVTRGGDDA